MPPIASECSDKDCRRTETQHTCGPVATLCDAPGCNVDGASSTAQTEHVPKLVEARGAVSSSGAGEEANSHRERIRARLNYEGIDVDKGVSLVCSQLETEMAKVKHVLQKDFKLSDHDAKWSGVALEPKGASAAEQLAPKGDDRPWWRSNQTRAESPCGCDSNSHAYGGCDGSWNPELCITLQSLEASVEQVGKRSDCDVGSGSPPPLCTTGQSCTSAQSQREAGMQKTRGKSQCDASATVESPVGTTENTWASAQSQYVVEERAGAAEVSPQWRECRARTPPRRAAARKNHVSSYVDCTALAQALAGVGASVFNWSYGRCSPWDRSSLARILQRYLYPVAHISSDLAALCEELAREINNIGSRSAHLASVNAAATTFALASPARPTHGTHEVACFGDLDDMLKHLGGTLLHHSPTKPGEARSPSSPPMPQAKSDRIRLARKPPKLQPGLGVCESRGHPDGEQCLRVTIMSASLTLKGFYYATCCTLGRPESQFQTAVSPATREPVWEHEAALETFAVEDSIEFTMVRHDKDPTAEDTIEGIAHISGADLFFMIGSGVGFEVELEIQCGRIRVKICAMPDPRIEAVRPGDWKP